MSTHKEMTGSLVFIVLGAGYLAYNTKYPMATWSSPGPAVFPLIIGGVLVILAVCHLIQSVRETRRSESQEGTVSDVQSTRRFLLERGEAKALILVMVFILYLLLVKGMGFFVSNFVFVVVSSRLMGAKDWPKPIALAVGINLFCYLLFEVWLKLSLPKGFLF